MVEQNVVDTARTRAVANAWFAAQRAGDAETGIQLLDENIEWINYTVVPGMNDSMSWIGTYRGIEEVVKSWQVFVDVVQPKVEELVDLIVDGENAIGIVHEISLVKATQKEFEIEFVQWLQIRNGKIVRWKSYTDPSPILLAMNGR